MTLPILRGPRRVLRAPRVEDREAIVAGAGDFEVSRWLAVVPHPYTPADADWFIGECLAGRIDAWAITHEGRVIGMIGLDDGFGYWLARDAWGQGFATEAGRLVLAHHFAQGAAEGTWANVFVGNDASANVLRKLGFRDEGPATSRCEARGLASVPARRMVLGRDEFLATGQT